MFVSRHANIDHIDVDAVEQCLQVRKDLSVEAHLGHLCVGAFDVYVGDGDEFNSGEGSVDLSVHTAHESESNDSYFHICMFFGGEFELNSGGVSRLGRREFGAQDADGVARLCDGCDLRRFVCLEAVSEIFQLIEIAAE